MSHRGQYARNILSPPRRDLSHLFSSTTDVRKNQLRALRSNANGSIYPYIVALGDLAILNTGCPLTELQYACPKTSRGINRFNFLLRNLMKF